MSKIKVTLAAAFVAAAIATPALAQGLTPYYNYAPQAPSYEAQTPIFGTQRSFHESRSHRLVEGRNAAVTGNFGGTSSSSTGRDTMVQELGN
jgi:hypothetical protein